MSLDVEGPQLIQVLGPNGAGKTTLLKGVAGLLKPMEGRVVVNGVDVTGDPGRASRFMSYVPHVSHEVSRHYPITVREMLEYSYLVSRPSRAARRKAGEVVARALKLVGVPDDFWDRSLWELSDGQRQRVMIARGVLLDPSVLLLDEPLSSVDPRGRAGVAELLGRLSRSKLVIASSHDPTLLAPHTDKVVLLGGGVCVIGDPGGVLKPEVLERVYGSSIREVSKCLHISDTH